MPLHLDSLMENSSPEILSWILQEELQNVDDAFAQSNKVYFLGSRPLQDVSTNRKIGKYVFTLFSNRKEQRNEILDIDIVLNNITPVPLRFEKKLPQSSDSNEYYEAIIADTDQHFIIETVNRYTIEKEIEGTTQEVYLSAFPFALTIFDSEKDFNKFCGFEKAIDVANTGLMVHGISTTFISPGDLLNHEDHDEAPWSFIVGTIADYQEVRIAFGKNCYNAYLVLLRCALGELPTLIGTEVFDTRKIGIGKIVGMNASVKANFVKDKYPAQK